MAGEHVLADGLEEVRRYITTHRPRQAYIVVFGDRDPLPPIIGDHAQAIAEAGYPVAEDPGAIGIDAQGDVTGGSAIGAAVAVNVITNIVRAAIAGVPVAAGSVHVSATSSAAIPVPTAKASLRSAAASRSAALPCPAFRFPLSR